MFDKCFVSRPWPFFFGFLILKSSIIYAFTFTLLLGLVNDIFILYFNDVVKVVEKEIIFERSF